MKKNLGVAFLLLVLLQSCSMHVTFSEKEELARLAGIVDNAFKENDSRHLKLIGSTETQNRLEFFDNIVAGGQNISKTDTSTQILYEKITVGEKIQFTSQIKGKYKYTYAPTAKEKECYTKVYIRPDINENNSWMVSFVFVKENKIWKLRNLGVGFFEYEHKTANEWYQIARAYNEDSDTFSSFQAMQIAMVLAKPNGDYLNYSSFNEMQSFHQKIAENALGSGYISNYLNSISTAPVFKNMTIEYAKGRLYPMVIYTSKFDLNDVKSLNEECDLINDHLKRGVPGLTKMADTVLYRVYNRNDNVNFHGFIKS